MHLNKSMLQYTLNDNWIEEGVKLLGDSENPPKQIHGMHIVKEQRLVLLLVEFEKDVGFKLQNEKGEVHEDCDRLAIIPGSAFQSFYADKLVDYYDKHATFLVAGLGECFYDVSSGRLVERVSKTAANEQQILPENETQANETHSNEGQL